ncbi:hypothetical protein VTO42DRAFT_3411 [Malbranchea cinnamomea]
MRIPSSECCCLSLSATCTYLRSGGEHLSLSLSFPPLSFCSLHLFFSLVCLLRKTFNFVARLFYSLLSLFIFLFVILLLIRGQGYALEVGFKSSYSPRNDSYFFSVEEMENYYSDSDELPERISLRPFRHHTRIPPDRILTDFDREQLKLSYLVDSDPGLAACIHWPSGLRSPVPSVKNLKSRRRHQRTTSRRRSAATVPKLVVFRDSNARVDVGRGAKACRFAVSVTKLGPVYITMRQMNGTLGKGKRRRLYLPDDDPDAMVVLFSILHGCNQHKRITDLDLIHRVAIVCDKYGACPALSSSFQAWLEEWWKMNGRCSKLSTCFLLLSAAHLARQPPVFTKAMVWIFQRFYHEEMCDFVIHRARRLHLSAEMLREFHQSRCCCKFLH